MVKKRKFGSVFKILRKLKGFSQFKLNELVGVKVTSISRYGWSVKKMSCGYFLNKALEVSMDILVFGEQNDADTINDKDLASLFVKTQLLTDKQKQTVKEFLSAFLFQNDVKKQLA